LGELRPGWDLIFLARKPFVDASFQDSSLAVEQVIKRAHLIEQ
jgi:RNase P protein component